MKKLYISLMIFACTSAGYCQSNEIADASIEELNTSKRYEINVHYPQFSDLTLTIPQQKINQRLKNFAESLAGKFREDMNDWEIPEGFDMNSSYEMKYNIDMLDNTIFSLRFENYSYYMGAAHPNTYIYALNYDMSTGDPITLSDVFSGINYLDVLAEYSKKDLLRQGEQNEIEPEWWWFAEGLAPVQDNFKEFNLTKDSLLLTFNAYQVGPYAMGIWNVKIPYSDLHSVINTTGILKRYW